MTAGPYFDSHCHLAMKEFSGDAEATLARARAAGVDEFLVVSASQDDFTAVRDVVSVSVREDRGAAATILFDPDQGLSERIIVEQFTV